MNSFKEIKWGLFGRRAFALLIDTLIFITVLTVIVRVFNLFVPGSDVREDAMQFYTEKDFNVFKLTAASTLILLGFYMVVSYRSLHGQTIGHRVAKIRISQLSGNKVGMRAMLRIIAISWARILVILAPGPWVASAGGPVILSIFVLIWGSLLILPIPISKSSNLTLWEKLGGYKFTLL